MAVLTTRAAAKWTFANFQSPTYAAVMMEYVTPPSYGSTVVNVGGLAKDGEIITAGSSHTAQHIEVKPDPETEWPEPGAMKLTWTGKTKDGKDVDAMVEGPLAERLDRVDVMAEVPAFLKKIVGGVAGTKPYIYQVSHSVLDLDSILMFMTVCCAHDSQAQGRRGGTRRARAFVYGSHVHN